MPRPISMLISANRNVFSKMRDFSSLSSKKAKTIIIPKISSFELLIFWVQTFVSYIQRPSFFVNSGFITLTSLLKSIRDLPNCCLTCIGCYIQETHCILGSDLELRGLVYFILGLVINVEVAKTYISSLAACHNIYWYSDPLHNSNSTPLIWDPYQPSCSSWQWLHWSLLEECHFVGDHFYLDVDESSFCLAKQYLEQAGRTDQ